MNQVRRRQVSVSVWATFILLALGLIKVPAGAAFPGDNGKIAWAAHRDGNDEIYVAEPDGSAPVNLTNHPAFDFNPAWSADGLRIAFESGRDGNNEIYVMNHDGTGVTRLTTNGAYDTMPNFSPDGTRLLFATNRDGNYEVYVMNDDGTGVTRLTTNAATDWMPVWSPDGTKIAFATNRDGNYEVYVMNADGTGATNLTDNAAHDASPAWSPDGAKLAFESSRTGNNEIFAMNADGNLATNLTDNAAHDASPAWSPDGTMITFQRTLLGPPQNVDVYTMSAGGATQTNITNDPADDCCPNWQPLKPVLTLVADPDHVWANGHKQATLTATLLKPDGTPMPDVLIEISAAPSEGVIFDAFGVVTDAAGQAVFHASSTKIDPGFTPRVVTFTVVRASDPDPTASDVVTFEPRKILFQFLGITSSVECTEGTNCQGKTDMFLKLRRKLRGSYGFKSGDFYWYSYKGGQALADGGWYTNDYGCAATAQTYSKSISAMSDTIDSFGGVNPNTQFYFVGHSQGGLIAFQELDKMNSIDSDTELKAIITMDSPLGGSPWWHVFVGEESCWDGRANDQMVALWDSASNHNRQGTSAKVLCTVLGITCDLPFGTRNGAAVTARPTVRVVNYGNIDDAVYRPKACRLTDEDLSVDNRTSQVVTTSDWSLQGLGGNHPQPGDPITSLLELIKDQDEFLECLNNSHTKVTTVKDGRAAAVIGMQHPGSP